MKAGQMAEVTAASKVEKLVDEKVSSTVETTDELRVEPMADMKVEMLVP